MASSKEFILPIKLFKLSVATLTSLLTMDLMKGLMMHIYGQEQHYLDYYIQCILISTLLYLSHLIQNKTLYLHQILGQIFT